MCSQPLACAGVGEPSVSRNHSETRGWKVGKGINLSGAVVRGAAVWRCGTPAPILAHVDPVESSGDCPLPAGVGGFTTLLVPSGLPAAVDFPVMLQARQIWPE